MVIDTSAVIAILLDEEDRRFFTEQIDASAVRVMSTATFVEISIVIEARRGSDGIRALDLLVDRAEIELIPVDDRQARLARQAWSQFGKGRHAAALNYGDCFSYALAKELGQPLLFKGDDFARTDIGP